MCTNANVLFFSALVVTFVITTRPATCVLRVDVVTFVAVTGERNFVNETFGQSSNGVAPMESAIQESNSLYGDIFTVTLTKLIVWEHCINLVAYVTQMAAEYYYTRNGGSDFLVVHSAGCGEQDELSDTVSGFGNVTFDGDGVRRVAIVIKDYDLVTGIFRTAMTNDWKICTLSQLISQLDWGQGDQPDRPPLNEPYCGFRGQSLKCLTVNTLNFHATITSSILASCAILTVLGVAIWFYRKSHDDIEHSKWWCLTDDINQLEMDDKEWDGRSDKSRRNK